MLDSSLQSNQGLNVLVVDDDASLRKSIKLNLEHAGFVCSTQDSATNALVDLKSSSFDIILCDLRLPEMSGIEFIRKCSQSNPDVAVVLMTGFGSSALALEAIQAGAYDYISKPFAPEELILTLRKIEEREKLKAENQELRSVVEQTYSFANIVAQSKVMKDIFETVKRLANFNTTVLIRGESGTGKELLARAIHHNSPRRGKPFVAINCGAIPDNLMESELFGHKKGAFTDAVRDKTGLFEEANGGTIFLDEIGELPLHLQVKLLRVLQEQQIHPVGEEKPRSIDVRIVAATLRDLEEDVEIGRFRDDLFYRLNVVALTIPALRERPEDIPVLVRHFLAKHNKKLGTNVKEVHPDALKCLMNYNWRGNVRELENCLERSLVLTESNSVDVQSLPTHIQEASGFASKYVGSSNLDNLSIKQRTKDLETELIIRALEQTKGNRTRAAKILEISHRALLYKLKEYNLENQGKK